MPTLPTSTYRLQLHAGFTLDQAAAIANYLQGLGISHVYASPYLQAAPGSTHGYDVVDHHSISQELGGEEAHARFCKRLGECSLGQILDIVPNHMSLVQNNRYWWDVLENGPASRYAAYFDIDWESNEARLRNKVLLPVLEDQYGVVLAKGAIQLVREDTHFAVDYHGMHLPVAPNSLTMFLSQAASMCNAGTECAGTLGFLADAFARLPQPESEDREAIATRLRDRTVLYRMLELCCKQEAKAVACIDEAITEINRDADKLDGFLQQQNYRLAFWRVADQDLGYRRFFDVNSLIGLRVELEQVFLETHERILQWLRAGVIDGVRVDHADGLRDPQRYFERLRQTAPLAYVIAEKILGRQESLRKSWPIEGTTGYEVLNQINGLLISSDGLKALDKIYRDFTGETISFGDLVHDKKLAVAQETLGSDVNRLASLFVKICESDRDHRDYTRADIRRALREVAICYSVYRTYISPERGEAQPEDVAIVEKAVAAARERRGDLNAGLYDFISDVLLLRRRGPLESEFLLRFQQFTSPVMAKGVEDAALYCYNRLVAANEVGGDPEDAPVGIDEFHRNNLAAQADHPLRMVTLTTHDTKRGEDARARLAVLAELPEYFRATMARWAAINRAHKTGELPDKNTEYFFYQTAIGAWPLSADRAWTYMEKAVRESRRSTSWIHIDENYEKALQNFVRQSLADKSFCAEVEQMVARLQPAGRSNSLAQTLLKCTVPGVPDLYQGAELWEHRLVDPDNRTPVDFDLRRFLLEQVKTMNAEQAMQQMADGTTKLWLIYRVLQLRRQHAEFFDAKACYTPLAATGDRREHLLAFLRAERVLIAVPRLTLGVANGWGNTKLSLPGGTWRNVLTEESFAAGEYSPAKLFAKFPVALFTKDEA